MSLLPKDGTLLGSVGRHPHGKAVTKKIALAIDVKLDLDLPVGGGQGQRASRSSRIARDGRS